MAQWVKPLPADFTPGTHRLEGEYSHKLTFDLHILTSLQTYHT